MRPLAAERQQICQNTDSTNVCGRATGAAEASGSRSALCLRLIRVALCFFHRALTQKQADELLFFFLPSTNNEALAPLLAGSSCKLESCKMHHSQDGNHCDSFSHKNFGSGLICFLHIRLYVSGKLHSDDANKVFGRAESRFFIPTAR